MMNHPFPIRTDIWPLPLRGRLGGGRRVELICDSGSTCVRRPHPASPEGGGARRAHRRGSVLIVALVVLFALAGLVLAPQAVLAPAKGGPALQFPKLGDWIAHRGHTTPRRTDC